MDHGSNKLIAGVKRRISWQDMGFTLVELVIALGIITIGIFWFFTVILYVIRSNSHNERSMVATTYAQKLLEDAHGTSTTSTTATSYTQGGISYTGSRTVSFGNGTSTSGFLQTRVTVSWRERGGTKTVEVISFQ